MGAGAVAVASAALAAFKPDIFYNVTSARSTKLVPYHALEPTLFGWGAHRLVTEWREESYEVPGRELELNRVLAFVATSLALSILAGVLASACAKAPKRRAAAQALPQKALFEEGFIAAVDLDVDLEVKLLVEKGAKVNVVFSDGTTPLTRAIIAESRDVVSALLQLGADPELTDRHGRTPLMWASRKEDAKTVKRLLKQGADINRASDKAWTPLMYAIRAGKWSMVELLKKRGANGRIMAVKRLAHVFDFKYEWEEGGRRLSSDGSDTVIWARELIQAIDLLTEKSEELIPRKVKACLVEALNYVADYKLLSEAKRMERFDKLRVKILAGGYKDHSICFVLTKDALDIANHGDLLKTSAIESYALVEAEPKKLLKYLKSVDQRSDCKQLLRNLRASKHLERSKSAPQEKDCPLQIQRAGTCSYASLIAAVWSLLVHEMGVGEAKRVFQAISEFYQLRSVDELISLPSFKSGPMIHKHGTLFSRVKKKLAHQSNEGVWQKDARELQKKCSEVKKLRAKSRCWGMWKKSTKLLRAMAQRTLDRTRQVTRSRRVRLI
jgi:hypothetical protein